MSNKKMQEILKDLYLIDPSLKKEEDKIIAIIENIIENQPNIELNQEFIVKLKEKVFLEIENLEKNKEMKIFSWQKIFYISTSSALVILLSIFAFSSFLTPIKKTKEKDAVIIALSERAFGDLLISSELGRKGQESSLNQREDMVLGLGSADGVASSNDLSIMPYPIEQNSYKYVYKGSLLEDLDLSSIPNLVYKRDNDTYLSKVFASSLKNVSDLPFSLNSFTQTELQHFNLIENREFGYSVAVNLSNNSISIYSNWEKWPQPYQNCFDEDCVERLKLNANDMLSESELIAIADNFLAEYNINLNDYSQAELSEETLNQLMSPRNNYYPEYVNVIYPLHIEGKEVFGAYGGKEGLEVSINIREKKVSNFYNLNFSRLQSSSYQLINDTEKINDLLSKGGLNPDYYYNNDENSYIEIELDEPKIALVKTWLSSPDRSSGVEIFIPSLIFKIKNKPNEYFNRQNVIIPLIKEIFEDSLEKINNQSYIEIDILPAPRNIDYVETEIDGDFRIMPIQ